MNPEMPQKPEEAEASLTALLLGELPHEEAAALHHKLAQDAELAALYERLKHTINLVRETIGTPAEQTADQPAPLKLSEDRRQKLLQHFKTVAPREFARPRRRSMPWLVPVGIAAGFVILGALFFPIMSSSRHGVPSLAFHRWSLSQDAASVPLMSAEAFTKRVDREGVSAPSPTAPAPALAKPSETAIVLANPTEPNDTAIQPSAKPPELSPAVHGAFLGPKENPPPSSPNNSAFVSRFAYAVQPPPAKGAVEAAAPAPASAPVATGAPWTSFDGSTNEVRVFRLSNANASETADQISELFPRGPKSGSLGSGAPSSFFRNGAGAVADGSDRMRKPASPVAVADPRTSSLIVTAPKTVMPQIADLITELDSDKSRKEVAGHYELRNAAPEDISGALQDLFQRSNARQQNKDEVAMLGQGSTLYMRETGNAQPAPGATIAGVGGAGGGFGGIQQQDHNGTPIGGAFFPIAPQTHQSVTVAGEDSYNTISQVLTKASSAAVAKGRQADAPASVSFFTQPEAVGALEAGRMVKNEGQIQALGEPSAPPQDVWTSGTVNGSLPPLPLTPNAGSPPNRLELMADTGGNQKQGNASLSAGQGKAPAQGGEPSPQATGFAFLGPPEPKALGYNWHLGNDLATAGQVRAQGGTAPPNAGLPTTEGKTRSTPDLELAWSDKSKKGRDTTVPAGDALAITGSSNQGFDMSFDNRALPGLSVSDGSQLPVPGDVPAVRQFYRFKEDEAGSGGTVKAEEKVKSVELAYATDGERTRSAPQALGKEPPPRITLQGITTLSSPDVRMSLLDVTTNVITIPPTENGWRSPSSVVLPRSQGETSVSLKDGSSAEQKGRQLADAKQDLEESQRYRQILDTKIASELIETNLPNIMRVEIVDKAAAQPTQKPSLGDRIQSALGGKAERSARIKIERDQSDISGLAEHGQTQNYDPYFIQTESERMQSESVLGKVIDDLDLKKAWANKQDGGTLTRKEALARLKKSLDVRPVPNSSLIDVGVKSDSPDEAARIANAVAEAYRDQRLQQTKELALANANELVKVQATIEQKIASAKQEVERLREAPKASSTAQSDTSPPKPAVPATVPQPEVQTTDNAFSTFSLNVSDVSFKLAAASLEKGVMPEPATVRSEEFINAFDYRDPEPPPGVAVGFAWERAQYPFAQNRDLLRFSIKTAAQGREPGRPMNIVLLLDTSGSMERADRVQIIREALRVLAGQLQPQDKLSIVTFARTARLWADGVPGNQAAQVVEEVSDITPQGGTNLEDAMNLAYATALRHYLAGGINRVVLLTDGAANLGDVEPETLKQKVEANRKQGIALDCFGIGWEGYNDDLLEVLCRNGDGRYGFVNTPEEAAAEFAGQLAGALHVAASDVKVQVEFNPARVTAYRQIGYAKHQLTKEQFRDNTVNAAQIGAAEAGNALYVVAVNPAGDGPLATVRVRYRVPGTSDYREQERTVPYTGNAVALEQASPAMRLAATASAFSEWLVSSPYAQEVSPDQLLGYLRGVPEVYGADARPKKLEWMIRQAKSIAGK